MRQFVEGAFELLAVLFDKIAILNRFKGYRTIIGFIGLGIVKLLTLKGILSDPTLINTLEMGLIAWSAMALNAKGRGSE